MAILFFIFDLRSHCWHVVCFKNYAHYSCYVVFVLAWYRLIWPKPFRVNSLTLQQSNDCPGARLVILKYMGDILMNQVWSINITKTNKANYNPTATYDVLFASLTHFVHVNAIPMTSPVPSPRYEICCHEPLNEAHESTFSILENYHCWLYIWYPQKLPLLTISRLWHYCGPSNYRFNFLLYWYASWVLFLGHQCAFVFPIYVWKYRKYTIDLWIVVYIMCASAVISPLRQWFDSCAKSRLKMCHTFMYNTFCCWLILLSSLYIELALKFCTNPDNGHCFGTIFPNQNFVFASICAIRPVHIQSDQYRSCSTVKQRRTMGAFIPMGSNQKQRCGSEFVKWHDIYTPEECADEWRQNNADLKLLENCVMNAFIMFGITATGLENSPQSLDVYTVSQSHSVVMSVENPAPENTSQSLGELRNGHVANFKELLYQTGSKNGVI